MLKIKVINHSVLCATSKEIDNKIKDLKPYIKIFFNVGTNLNHDVLRLLEEINKTYIVTDDELQVSYYSQFDIMQIIQEKLKRGQEMIPAQIRTFKNGLY